MALHQHNNFQGNPGAVVATLRLKHSAGAAAGDPVVINVKYAPTSLDRVTKSLRAGALPDGYVVISNPSQECFTTVKNQTNESFDLVLTPPFANRIAPGTVRVAIIG